MLKSLNIEDKNSAIFHYVNIMKYVISFMDNLCQGGIRQQIGINEHKKDVNQKTFFGSHNEKGPCDSEIGIVKKCAGHLYVH